MLDSKNLFHDQETVIGHIEISAGGVLLTDSGWEEDLPKTTQESLALDLDMEPGKIPVIAVRKNNKRFLILAIDDMINTSFAGNTVTVVDKVEEPEDEEDKKKQ